MILRSAKKTLLYGLIVPMLLLTAGAAIYASLYPNIARCFFIEWAEFDQENERLFFTPDTPLETRHMLDQIVQRSQLRVAGFWGKSGSKAPIIYCHNEEAFDLYGAGTPGVAYLTPMGTYIVIGPRGLTIDIVSHELCHVELFDRIGWLNSEFQKPAWFDEGLALMLDYRYAKRQSRARHFGFLVDWDRRIAQGSKAFSLEDLHSRSAFTQPDLRRTAFAYITAGMEVSRWLDHVGSGGLHDLVYALRQGEDFEAAYRRIEVGTDARWRAQQW